MSVNSRLKTISITGQKKAFYRQGIPESSCTRKETVDIDILNTSMNGDKKIMQLIRTTFSTKTSSVYTKPSLHRTLT